MVWFIGNLYSDPVSGRFTSWASSTFWHHTMKWRSWNIGSRLCCQWLSRTTGAWHIMVPLVQGATPRLAWGLVLPSSVLRKSLLQFPREGETGKMLENPMGLLIVEKTSLCHICSTLFNGSRFGSTPFTWKKPSKNCTLLGFHMH